MPSLTAVILAAGQGTRMRSELPKMLHPLCGRPLVGWPIAAALEAGADRVVVVDSDTQHRSRAGCRDGRDTRRPAGARRHRRRRPVRPRQIDPGGDRRRAAGRRRRSSPARRSRGSCAAHAKHAPPPRWPR